MDLERMVRIPDKMFFNIGRRSPLRREGHVLRYGKRSFPS